MDVRLKEMDSTCVTNRLGRALDSSDPTRAVLDLAVVLRDEGVPKDDLYELYSAESLLHRDLDDESKWDALCDTMDLICDWCASGKELYPSKP